MTFIQKPNSGQLFKNDKKSKDTDPDLTGSCNLENVDQNGEVVRKEFWISGWNNTSKAGKEYINLKLNIKKSVYNKEQKKTLGREKKEEKLFNENTIESDEIPF